MYRLNCCRCRRFDKHLLISVDRIRLFSIPTASQGHDSKNLLFSGPYIRMSMRRSTRIVFNDIIISAIDLYARILTIFDCRKPPRTHSVLILNERKYFQTRVVNHSFVFIIYTAIYFRGDSIVNFTSDSLVGQSNDFGGDYRVGQSFAARC